MSDKVPSWKRKSSAIVYDNPWITVHHDEVTAPTGHEGIYGRVHYKNVAIGIIPIDKDWNTWLVGQYRYPIEQYSWEIPEGGGPVQGEAILEAAKRELAEEAGLSAKLWTEIQRFHVSNSVSDELGVIYLARELDFTATAPDETEVLELRKLPFDDGLRLVENGEITDSLTIIAYLKVSQLRKNNKL